MESKQQLLPSADAAVGSSAERCEDDDAPIHLSRSRWWVLATFSAFAFLQGGLWAVPGCLSAATSQAYNLDNDTIALLVNWGPIMYIPFALPFAWWMDRPGGMRSAVLLGHALVTVGAVLRVVAAIGLPPMANLACIHLSYILNAIAGPVAMGAVGKLSELWFPLQFRGTATAIMSEFNILGEAFAFLVGPAMVPDNTLQQLQQFNYLCLGLCLLAMLALLVHFPSQPASPPSKSAAELRARDESEGFSLSSLKTALASLARNRSFLVLICAYGFATGMFGSWTTMMSINLSSVFTSTMAGYLSFVSTIAGNVGGIILGRLIDRFRHLKAMLVALMGLGAVSFTAFAVLCQVMPLDGNNTAMILLFVTGALGGFALNSTIPLFFELSLEVSHPLPEATVVTVLTTMNNVGCIIFLGIPVDETGSGWMNWLFSGTVLFFTLALAVGFKEEARRYDVDAGLAQEGGHGKELADEEEGAAA